jgi:very-short-patch-repair endonuclease
MRPRSQLRAIWTTVAGIAARQHGVISRRGLLRIGVHPEQVKRLIRAGFLHPIHAGVYAVGHTNLSREGVWMAAVLAGGQTAVLSHHSAAALHRLIDPGDPTPLHVTARQKGLVRPGIHFHSSPLIANERTKRRGIPTTTVHRTVLELAAHLDAFALERLLAEAHFRGHRDPRPFARLIELHPSRRGIANLRVALASGNATLGRTESPLEDRFLLFLDERWLERPELNPTITIAGRRIRPDCLWRALRVIVECDGRDAHQRRRTWERDRIRDRRLLVAGYSPVRVTSKQLDGDRDALEADLRSLGVGDRLAT